MKRLPFIIGALALVIFSFTLPARAQTAIACDSTVTVAAGDTLSKIAQQAYGDPAEYFPIFSATNSQAIADTSFHFIDNPDQIEIGWKVCVPGQEVVPAGLDTAALQNASYQSDYGTDGVAKLTDGKFSAPAEPGTPLMNNVFLGKEVAYGDINGTPYAALVLIENGGGSGVFSTLHLARSQDGQVVDTAHVTLGDRINLTSLSIQDGKLVVGMTTQGPDEPMCCGTQRQLDTFTLNGAALDAASTQVVGNVAQTPSTQPSPTPAPSSGASAQLLTGTVWRWLGTQMNDGAKTTPDVPSNYLIQFLSDGTVSIKADCNQVGGMYTIDGNQLTIVPGPSTLVACPPGSLGNEFVTQLSNVGSFLGQGANLILEIKLDSGSMTFEAAGPEGIAGTMWDVVNYNNGNEAVVSVLNGTSLTMNFGEDGNVSGKGGCNQYGGSYTTEGTSLTVGPLIRTLIACDPDEVNTQESQFLAALENSATYEITGDTITIRDADGAIQVVASRVTAPAGLPGTSWTVTVVNNGNEAVVSVLSGTELTLNFGTDGRVNGNAGCNTFNGPFTSTAVAIDIGPLISTRIFCETPAGTMEQEAQYLAALENATTYELSPDILILRDADGDMLVNATATTPGTLAGTHWQVNSVNNGNQGVVSLIAGTELTLNFGDDGTVSGNAGCNTFSGSYQSAKVTVTIGPLVSTRMFCESPTGVMEQEAQYLAALENSATYEIHNGALNIRDTEGATQVNANPALPGELAGSSWDVVNYNNGNEAVVSLIAESTITLNFGTANTVSGKSGCNNYTGGYESTGDTLKVGGLATTFKLCHKPDGVMEQEAKYLTALSHAATFDIAGSTLTIRDGSGAMQVVATQAQ